MNENKNETETAPAEQKEKTGVISENIARRDIDKWLDVKKIRPKKREEKKESIDKLVDAVMDGMLSVENDGSKLVQKLIHPIGEIRELSYKSRISLAEKNRHTLGVNIAEDFGGYILAHVAALTDKPKTLVGKMDTEDNDIANSIALFFI